MRQVVTEASHPPSHPSRPPSHPPFPPNPLRRNDSQRCHARHTQKRNTYVGSAEVGCEGTEGGVSMGFNSPLKSLEIGRDGCDRCSKRSCTNGSEASHPHGLRS